MTESTTHTPTQAPAQTQASDSPPTGSAPFTTSRGALPGRAVLLIGLALAICVTDPTDVSARGVSGWLLTVLAALAAVWAAPAVARRPAIETTHWSAQLARHRNTVFAVAAVCLATFSDPPVWLMAVDAALLLAYLLGVDLLAAGPIGVRQLRRGVAPLTAAAAIAVVLLGARSPVDSGAVWGRILAAIAIAAAAAAAGAALWLRQSSKRPSRPSAPTTSDNVKGR